ncbi:hypothetical protein CMI37_29000 [Candidatus Pacearchaeota archaeon]|nr:hypothetical protein [Candidatus Pacearchaeota archaeon]
MPPKDFKDYFSSLKPISEKFTRIADKGGTDEETGKWVEGTMEEYVDKDAIIEHFFLGDKHTQTRTKGENEEGWNQQKWDKGSNQWVDVSSDYEKTTTDPRMERRDIREITSWGAGGDFKQKWDEWADEALPSERFLGASFEDVSNRMMIEQLKYSKDPNDIVIKKPDLGKQKIASVRRQRDEAGKHIVGPIIYKMEDGSEWMAPKSHSSRTSHSKASKRIGRTVQYLESVYGPKGDKISGGDLSTTGWIPVKNTEGKLIDGWKEEESWNVIEQNNYRVGQ